MSEECYVIFQVDRYVLDEIIILIQTRKCVILLFLQTQYFVREEFSFDVLLKKMNKNLSYFTNL